MADLYVAEEVNFIFFDQSIGKLEILHLCTSEAAIKSTDLHEDIFFYRAYTRIKAGELRVLPQKLLMPVIFDKGLVVTCWAGKYGGHGTSAVDAGGVRMFFKKPLYLFQRTGLKQGVGIQEQDDVVACMFNTGIASCCRARVFRHGNDISTFFLRDMGAVVCRSVINNDDFVMGGKARLNLDGRDQGPDGFSGIVTWDNYRDGHHGSFNTAGDKYNKRC